MVDLLDAYGRRDAVLLRIVIVIHIAAGLTAVAAGATAMLAPKRRGRHPRSGHTYLGALVVLTTTAIVLAAARPHTAYLLILGAVALVAAGYGWRVRRLHHRGWRPRHITAMALSYTAMVTAFYVDNGPRLPLWSLLPPLTFWFLPAAVALPLLVRALNRHAPRATRRQTAEAGSADGL
ncbi:hypothetical protein [Streptomyces sp. NPDC058434]|uniref:hypothetical protein n=1 Tax=Streptomyces sp. NPDC058434 TaxID=3346498 RepID=UPI00364F296C